jgi:hypothetical protein
MTEDELRALVREAITRHLRSMPAPPSARAEGSAAPPWRAHPSFGRFLVARGDDDGGPCIIEPSVHCNHCGFCQSYGH